MRANLAGIAAALLLSGCFGGDDDAVVPAELVPFDASVKVSRAWSATLGSESDGLLLGLAPVSNGARVYAAADTGRVYAFDALTGKTQWQVKTDLPLSAGPGLGRDALALGSSNGDVILLAAADGAMLWKVNVASEVLSAPAVADDVVVVRTVDGRLVGLSNQDGSEQWSLQHRVQGLTLRGSSVPVISGELAICGFDDGRIAAVNLADGAVVWESALSEQRGRTALDRLADIDARVVIVGEDVFVAGYQGSAALLSLQTGQPVWQQELSSHNDLALDWNRVYLTAAGDTVTALTRSSGVIAWQQAELAHRRLSGPAVAGATVAVGDFEGYVHWLNAQDGKFVARQRAGKGAITAAPIVVGNLIFVQTTLGNLTAFRVGES